MHRIYFYNRSAISKKCESYRLCCQSLSTQNVYVKLIYVRFLFIKSVIDRVGKKAYRFDYFYNAIINCFYFLWRNQLKPYNIIKVMPHLRDEINFILSISNFRFRPFRKRLLDKIEYTFHKQCIYLLQ